MICVWREKGQKGEGKEREEKREKGKRRETRKREEKGREGKEEYKNIGRGNGRIKRKKANHTKKVNRALTTYFTDEAWFPAAHCALSFTVMLYVIHTDAFSSEITRSIVTSRALQGDRRGARGPTRGYTSASKGVWKFTRTLRLGFRGVVFFTQLHTRFKQSWDLFALKKT